MRRPVFITHPSFEAAGFGRHHPLSIPRHAAVLGLARALGRLLPTDVQACALPSRDVLARFHDRAYLQAFEAAVTARVASPEVRARYHLGTMECPLFDGLWDRARATVGGAILAAELALAGHLPLHPGGGTHHGRRDRASGFCYLNDPVFAVLTLLDAGLERVLYVDLDAHHGDGVEAAFADDPRVMTVSIHEANRWPGTGRVGDRAGGQARNMPVPRGFNDSELDHLMQAAVLPLAHRFAPSAIVVTAGADALAGDPLSGLALSNVALADAVMALVAASPRAVILGGGGYNPWTTARAWTGLWCRLAGREVPYDIGAGARNLLAGLDCDLVDEEDRDPAWLTTLWDAPRPGPVRDEVRAVSAAVIA